MKYLFIILVSCLFSVASVGAETYYFSSTTGNDSYTSTQAKNSATAWKTLSKINSISFKAGDTIRFKRGDTFYGSINKSGIKNIVFADYGSGAKPIITGLTKVSTWTKTGTNIYESNAITAASNINVLLHNNKQYAIGRYPNADAPNGGYLNFESHGSNYIIDNENTLTSAYVGATIVVRTNHWLLEQRTITAINGNKITFNSPYNESLTDGYGYFIQNTPLVLDQPNEWYYNSSTHKITIYSTTAPTNLQVSTVDNLFTLSGANHILLNNLVLKGANKYAITSEWNGDSDLTVKNCALNYSGIDAIALSARTGFVMDNCTITNSNSCGINLGYHDLNAVITNTTILNTATFAGMLFPDPQFRYGFGIFSDGTNLTAKNNTIINTGYIGIFFSGSNNLIQNNYVDTFCTLLDDGGGIYTDNYASNGVAPRITNLQIISNIVLHGIGAKFGTHESDPNYIPAEGIYLDDNTMSATVLNNTAAYCAHFGIYCHNDSGYTLRGNTLYNNAYSQIGAQEDGQKALKILKDGISRNNQLFTTIEQSKILYLASPNNDMLAFMNADSNYYCKPFDTTNIIQTNWFGGSTNNYHLSNWRSTSNQDMHTLQTPVTACPDSVLFFYNTAKTKKTISLNGTYKSLAGKIYTNSVTLNPYSSVILLKLCAFS